MGLRCQVTYSKGEASVFNEDGTPSVLYRDALELTKNQQKSLDIWATASLEDFELLTGKKNKNDEVKLDEVLKFYNVLKTQTSELSPSEIFETKQFMKSNGFKRLSDLRKTLHKTFKNSEVKPSNLYSSEELQTLDLKKVNELLNKIDNKLLTEDFLVEPEKNLERFKNTEFKTLFGTYETVPQEILDKSIEQMLPGFTEEDFYNNIQSLPYPAFAEKFYSNKKFAQEVINRFQGVTKVPILEIQNGSLVQSKTNTYTTIKNTLKSDINRNLVLAELEYLKSIDLDLWNENTNEIQGVLGELEEELVKLNIDIIGVKKLYKNREEVINLLTDLNNLLVSPTEENLVSFSETHDRLIPKKENLSIEKLPNVYQGLTIVKLYSDKSDNELFEKFGLIRISPNTYHKIDRSGDKTDLYEYVYNEVVNDRLNIPSDVLMVTDYKDILNKPQVLEGISRFINLRNSRIISQFQEEISLYQLIFDHQPLSKPNVKQDISFLTGIKTDENYLKTDFISDFYNYILREKLNDSSVYRNILSKFEINDQDIVLKEPIESIQDLEYREELSDYIRLKKDSEMKALIELENSDVLDDLLYLNMPELVPEASGNFSLDGDYLITGSNALSFLKTRGKIYRKALENSNVNLYIQVKTPQDLIYYTSNTNFSFEESLAKNVLNIYDELETKVATDKVLSDSFTENLRNSSLTPIQDFSVMLYSNINIKAEYSKSEQNKITDKINRCE